jgi:hypothetical protein
VLSDHAREKPKRRLFSPWPKERLANPSRGE